MENNKKEIILLMLPFWTPLIPPQGICYLKNHLQKEGHSVKTFDVNIEEEFNKIYRDYFNTLKKYVPEDKRGNYYNIGHDVLRNHLLVYNNQDLVSESNYIEMLKVLIYNTFYTKLEDDKILEIDNHIKDFYSQLKTYIVNLLNKYSPDVVGISVLRDNIGPSMFAFKLCKEISADILTIMGGSVFSDHLLQGTPNFENFVEKTPYVDKYVIGEGEVLFSKILNNGFEETKRVFTLTDLSIQEKNAFIERAPDMDDFNVSEIYSYLSAQASKSCPNQCSFCNVPAFYGTYKEKLPNQTADEMISLYKKYGLQVFFMNDSLLNHIASGLSEEFIKRKVLLYWDGYLRVGEEVTNHETTLKWRKGGLYRVRMGVESGSQHVLDLMHKGITVDQTKLSLKSLSTAGIKTTTYWVIGHPGETEADFEMTLQLLEETSQDIYEAECNVFIYGYNGQSSSDQWTDKRKLLYPQKFDDLLMIKSWYVDTFPTREETYRRMNRFVQKCKELGIPNPYTLKEVYEADKRWEKIHRNSVPPITEFKKGKYVDDTSKLIEIKTIESNYVDDDFCF